MRASVELRDTDRLCLRKQGDVEELRKTAEETAGLGVREIVGADEDHTVPASVSKAQYKRYERSPAKTDYLEFAGRPHLHMVAPDWQEVAEAIDSWLDGVLAVPVAEARQTTP